MNITSNISICGLKAITFKSIKKDEKPKLIDINKKVDRRRYKLKTFQSEKKVVVEESIKVFNKEIENMLTLMLYKDMFCSEYCELLENTEDIYCKLILEQKE